MQCYWAHHLTGTETANLTATFVLGYLEHQFSLCPDSHANILVYSIHMDLSERKVDYVDIPKMDLGVYKEMRLFPRPYLPRVSLT